MSEIGVAVLGFGFMGATHARAYQRAARDISGDAPVPRLRAIADRRGTFGESSGNLDSGEDEIALGGVELVKDPYDAIAADGVELVSVCTHTATHVELARAALDAGKHVLVEKPIALTSGPVASLAAASDATDLVCMPAMCMRFWPAWAWMSEKIAQCVYGGLRSVSLTRSGARPDWSPGFYGDDSQSGGALFDLHVHDTDYIVGLLGVPAEVVSAGDTTHLTTLYRFGGVHEGVHVAAEAGWDQHPSMGFRMRATIVCEDATLDFDFSRDDQLVVHTDGSSAVIDVGPLTGYDMEIRALLGAIGAGGDAPVSMGEAAEVTRVLEAERESLRARRAYQLG